MLSKKISAIAALLLTGLLSQGVQAMCYTIPHTISYQSGSWFAQGFEGDSSTCSQSSGDRWIEVCAKPSSSSGNYNMCASGYAYQAGTNFLSIPYLQYNTSYVYRARYRLIGGSLGVIGYGTIPAVSNGGSSSGSSSSGGGTCGNGYPVGHPLCDG